MVWEATPQRQRRLSVGGKDPAAEQFVYFEVKNIDFLKIVSNWYMQAQNHKQITRLYTTENRYLKADGGV